MIRAYLLVQLNLFHYYFYFIYTCFDEMTNAMRAFSSDLTSSRLIENMFLSWITYYYLFKLLQFKNIYFFLIVLNSWVELSLFLCCNLFILACLRCIHLYMSNGFPEVILLIVAFNWIITLYLLFVIIFSILMCSSSCIAFSHFRISVIFLSINFPVDWIYSEVLLIY